MVPRLGVAVGAATTVVAAAAVAAAVAADAALSPGCRLRAKKEIWRIFFFGGGGILSLSQLNPGTICFASSSALSYSPSFSVVLLLLLLLLLLS